MNHVLIEHELTHETCWAIDRDELQCVFEVFNEFIIVIWHLWIVT